MIFDPALHQYRVGERIIPSVTQVLKEAGYIDTTWMSEEARERGSAVHTLCERYAKGIRFDDAGRELASLEYVNAFAHWVRDNGVYAVSTEQIIHGNVNGHPYAGRYDLLCEIRRKRRQVDLKTGAKAKWHVIQGAAYALQSNPAEVSTLYLRADGSYKEDRYTAREILDGIEKFKDCF